MEYAVNLHVSSFCACSMRELVFYIIIMQNNTICCFGGCGSDSEDESLSLECSQNAFDLI